MQKLSDKVNICEKNDIKKYSFFILFVKRYCKRYLCLLWMKASRSCENILLNLLQSRHKSDNDVNNRIAHMVRDGQLLEDKWVNVKVGDIIRLDNNNFVVVSCQSCFLHL
jgi:magnesium-transporting ATPase (P-type)